MAESIPDDVAEQIVQVCRTAMGDELRSITHLGPHAVDHLYTRSDLDRAEDSLQFFESERRGFEAQQDYSWTELGEFRYTVRAFEDGYLGRVVVGDNGIYVTSESLTLDDFEEVSKSVRTLMEEVFD